MVSVGAAVSLAATHCATSSSAPQWSIPLAAARDGPAERCGGGRPDYRTDDPGAVETYQDALGRKGRPSLEARMTYTPDDADKRYSMYAYGPVFAEVGVDEALGRVRVRRVFGC